MAVKLFAGCGKAQLKDPIGVELSGYGYYLERKCTGVLDHLYVRCATLRSEEKKAVIISADLIGLTPALAEEIRGGIAAKFGFAQEEILLVNTHTHTGPATNRLVACGVMDEAYNAALPAVFYRAVRSALKDEKPVFSTAEVCQPIDPIGYNRVLFAEQPHDANVRGVMFYREGGDPVALISYPCHPVTWGTKDKISADYPGAVCRLCERNGVKAVFLNGICGDIDPVQNRIAWGSGTRATLAEYAKRIVEGFEAGLKPMEDPVLDTIRFESKLPVLVMSEEEIAAEKGSEEHPEFVEEWRVMMRAGQSPETTCAATAVRIGNVAFCGIPYEAYTVVGDIAREKAAGLNLAVLGCSDAPRNYLPDIKPGEERSYASFASLLYVHPFFVAGAAQRMGESIGDALKPWTEA